MEVHQRGLITGILMAALAISPRLLQASLINNLVK